MKMTVKKLPATETLPYVVMKTRVLQGFPISQEVRVSYLEFYIKFLYYLCMMPYKPRRMGNMLILHTNRLQHVICFLLLITTYWSIASQIRLASSVSIFRDPLMIIPPIMTVGEGFVYLIVVTNFWWKRKQMLELLTHTSIQHEKLGISRESWKFKSFLLCFLTVIVVCLVFYRFQRDLFVYGIQGQPNGYYEHEVELKTSWFNDLAGKISKIGAVASTIRLASTKCLLLGVVLSTFDISRKYNKMVKICDLESGSGILQNNEKCDFASHAKQLKIYFSQINEVSAACFLVWFVLNIPWMSYRLVEFFPTEVALNYWGNWVYDAVFMSLQLYVLTLCAETKRQIEKFKSVSDGMLLKMDPNLTWARTIMTHVEYYLKDCGIHGGRFFIFSYGFLGQTLGLVVAYALLVLQFQIQFSSPKTSFVENVKNM